MDYLAHPANVAIILARYDCEQITIVEGILHHVLEESLPDKRFELERKIAEGVEVRVIVDGYGSRPHGEAREMFTQLAASGAQIVVNDVFPLDRDGLYPDEQHIDWRQDEVGRADHRKRYVIDGSQSKCAGSTPPSADTAARCQPTFRRTSRSQRRPARRRSLSRR